MIALSFILIGYSSYSLVLIRSSFNPPIDENNPENILSFISYLKREQYGNRPLFHGQYYDAEVIDQKQEKIVYKRGKEKYEIKEKVLVMCMILKEQQYFLECTVDQTQIIKKDIEKL